MRGGSKIGHKRSIHLKVLLTLLDGMMIEAMRGLLLIWVLTLLWGWPLAGEAATRSPHRKVERGCAECHTTHGWKEIVFDHGQTSFDLEGRHAEQGCLDCHVVEDFTAATGSCLACHSDYHQGHLGDDCR